jgi:SdrD B-like domain
MRRMRVLTAVALIALLALLAFSGMAIAAEETTAEGTTATSTTTVTTDSTASTGGTGVVMAVVSEDTNGDGLADKPLSLLNGVTVNLYSQASDGTLTLLGSSVTGPQTWNVLPVAPWSGGWVGFNGLNWLEHHILEVVPPAGYFVVKPAGGRIDLGSCHCFASGEFLLAKETKSRLKVYKFVDMNENGVMDPGEAVLPGVTIIVDGGAQTGVTGSDGSVTFEVTAGSHTVAVDESTAPGYYATGPVTKTVLVPSGGEAVEYFGNAPYGSICGKKYNDKNKNGKYDCGEPTVQGVTIKLSGTTTSGELVNLEMVTGADGSYCFTGLKAGTYTVTEVVPAGWQAVGPTSIVVTLLPGQKITCVNFFNAQVCIKYGSISGNKYNDKNKNGKRDCYESTVKGVTIKLTGTTIYGELVNKQTVTSYYGSYSFTGLKAGTYTVTEVVPSGWVATGPISIEVTLLPGQSVTGINFFNAQKTYCGCWCF